MQLVYEDGSVRLYHGDARNLFCIANASVHLIVTSPPYWNAREYSQWSQYEDYLSDMTTVWRECHRVLCSGGRIAVNVPLGYGRPGNGGYRLIGDDTARALIDVGFEIRGHIIWDKSNDGKIAGYSGTAWGSWKSASNPSLRDEHEIIIVAHKDTPRREPGDDTITAEEFLEYTKSVWHIAPVGNVGVNAWHPAPFPIEIPRRLIQLYSFRGNTVLDPFGGSMTTVWASSQLGRIGIGVDCCLEYVQRAAGPLFCQ